MPAFLLNRPMAKKAAKKTAKPAKGFEESLWDAAGFVLANGSMSSNTKGEGAIRQKLVENDLVDCTPIVQFNLSA